MHNTIALSSALDNAKPANLQQPTTVPVLKNDSGTAAPAIVKLGAIADRSRMIEATAASSTLTSKAKFTCAISVERAIDDDGQTLTVHDRAHYVSAFKRGVEKTARATLETGRVVYEASRVLDAYEFQNFCLEIGYRDNSSTIRKFIAIGKVYPRFIEYADQLPAAWTTMYQITQIPADTFEAMLKKGTRLDSLKGKYLVDLLHETRPVDDMTKPLPFDSDLSAHKVGALYLTKAKIDDTDWRAIEKALNELQARLPIKITIASAFTDIVKERRLQNYEKSKKKFEKQEFRPDTWDMGEEANSVLPRDKVIAESNA